MSPFDNRWIHNFHQSQLSYHISSACFLSISMHLFLQLLFFFDQKKLQSGLMFLFPSRFLDVWAYENKMFSIVDFLMKYK